MRIRATFENVRTATKSPAPEAPAAGPSPAARNLALANRIADLIDRGLVADFTAAARLLGVSQPRLTHLMGLLLLDPEIQTAILFDELRFGDKELRALARVADWSEQRAFVARRSRSAPHKATPTRCLGTPKSQSRDEPSCGCDEQGGPGFERVHAGAS